MTVSYHCYRITFNTLLHQESEKMFTVSIFGSLNFGGIKSNHYLPTMKHGETGDPQLFIAVNGNQITQQSKEYAIPSELPQGEMTNCVSLGMDGELAFAGAGTHPSEAIANLAMSTRGFQLR
ncbi:hypothetical protein HQQ92_19465 [Shewanella sp. DC2-4]|uniref:hypothetical protein n=1 Tax=Shewanella sp. DC2-4 TaxID=2739431 RepID=UPI001564A05B|nr:hypothetical protein [Shewanella sp. DC2-4]NRD33908.1 hypothetical protein [Shewanella sp. DC2-4]